MKLKHSKIGIVFIVLTLVAWLIALPFLPTDVPMQYTSDDQVNWKAHKFLAPLFFLGLALLTYLIAATKGHSETRKNSHENFTSLNNFFHALGPIIAFVISIVVIFNALGFNISVKLFALLLVGCLLIIIGNLLQKIPQNKIMGIRNKWTLKNERVWKKTQRFSSRLYIIIGVLFVISAFLPAAIVGISSIVLILILVAAPMLYSYKLSHSS
ncbi:SdpI family protein [Staphylococcus massiliensis]|uniref:SdpI family protein n=1 Tax=Staphylococcus massiliensis TaxID=555791 RepID=UPI001EDE829A|nr:SdpI family protein [Staphylococcus massiliensis]MCG3399171.1 SdpI family protein [Staphylococcus massiliensis]MCG3402224.1 SdpI family protein [Staphylococcus massiliensis]MCG3412809.1 SdpI family protein [Staphylococcus massiliensis]